MDMRSLMYRRLARNMDARTLRRYRRLARQAFEAIIREQGQPRTSSQRVVINKAFSHRITELIRKRQEAAK